jgi:hypothetical protein
VPDRGIGRADLVFAVLVLWLNQCCHRPNIG